MLKQKYLEYEKKYDLTNIDTIPFLTFTGFKKYCSSMSNNPTCLEIYFEDFTKIDIIRFLKQNNFSIDLFNKTKNPTYVLFLNNKIVSVVIENLKLYKIKVHEFLHNDHNSFEKNYNGYELKNYISSIKN